MSSIDALASISDPYGDPGRLFDAAMSECDAWHRGRNAAYARLPVDADRPLIPAAMLSEMPTPVDGPGRWLGSSGTGGHSRRIFFDGITMGRIERIMRALFAWHGIGAEVPSRFLILAPDPSGPHAGYATAFRMFTGCAPVAEVVHAVTDDLDFDAEVAWDALRRWSADPAPVFIFGLTVFFEHLALSARPITFEGPIKGLTGGGWKGLARRLDRPEIVARLRTALGIDLRDLYGMTEHPVHYPSCTHGRFHVPAYSRVSLVAPEDGVGLLRLQSPMFTSVPAHDLLTSDRGRLGRGCGCGLDGPWFEFCGRVTAPTGTCAASAVGAGR